MSPAFEALSRWSKHSRAVTAKHDAEDRAAELPERAYALLWDLLASDALSTKETKVQNAEAVKILREADFRECGEFEGYLLDSDGSFVEPNPPFSCVPPKTCGHGGCACPCAEPECSDEVIAVVDGKYPACEAHR